MTTTAKKERISAFSGSKTQRREERRYVRMILGTSRDEAPGLVRATRAAQALDKIVHLASGGRFRLYLREMRVAAVGTQEEYRTPTQALAYLRDVEVID